jgi:hypothetical protein
MTDSSYDSDHEKTTEDDTAICGSGPQLHASNSKGNTNSSSSSTTELVCPAAKIHMHGPRKYGNCLSPVPNVARRISMIKEHRLSGAKIFGLYVLRFILQFVEAGLRRVYL